VFARRIDRLVGCATLRANDYKEHKSVYGGGTSKVTSV
jgi:hypothetical protein